MVKQRNTKRRSEFAVASREAIERVIADTSRKAQWKAGGEKCLTVKHCPATSLVRRRGHEGFKAQIWMERPTKGTAVCKFEIASDPSKPMTDDDKQLRD